MSAAATGQVKIVEAREEHIPFIAWVVLTAKRAHLGRCLLDFFVEGAEADRLRFTEGLAGSSARHFMHYSRFIVAEVDGAPAAALSGYFVEECGLAEYLAGMNEAGSRFGMTDEMRQAAWQRCSVRAKAASHCQPQRAPGAWIVESVATRPEHRRHGLVDTLLSEIADVGRRRGAVVAEVGVHIGNDTAQRAYEKAGFSIVEELRHPEYQAVLGCPGVRELRKAI